MTQQLTILTPFADLAELTDNFAQRVDEQRLMLPYAEPMPEGEWLQFEVQLADGTAALAGVGKVQGAFDNGEEHPPEYRFDVVLDSLQLEGMHEVMFERLLVARETQMKGEPVTGEVSVEDLEKEQASRKAQASAEDDGGWEDASDSTLAAPGSSGRDGGDPAGTGEVEVDDLEEEAVEVARPAAAAGKAAPKVAYPAAAPREPGKLPSPHTFNGRPLTRPTHPAAWSPEPAPRPDAAQSSGYFDYQGGVPRPAVPPRPELDPAHRVQPAPRPGAPWPRRGTGTHQAVGPTSEPAGAFEELGPDEQLTTGDGATSQVEAPPGEAEHEEW